MKHYVALLNGLELDGRQYERGDIVISESTIAGIGWATFTPPPDLTGRPVLEGIEDEPGGLLRCRYRIETSKETFSLYGRADIPIAAVARGDEKPRAPDPGIAIEGSAHGLVRWGRCRPVPPAPADSYNPLEWS
jgi:hypothetical protein